MECSPNLFARIVAHCRAVAPAEACGFIAGIGGRARRVYLVDNVHPDPKRFYTMHPEQQLAALFDMRRRGLELLAIFHSHSTGPPEPSPADIEQALWPDALYVIISLGPEGPSGGCRGRGCASDSTAAGDSASDSSPAGVSVPFPTPASAGAADGVEMKAFRIDRGRGVAIPVDIDIR